MITLFLAILAAGAIMYIIMFCVEGGLIAGFIVNLVHLVKRVKRCDELQTATPTRIQCAMCGSTDIIITSYSYGKPSFDGTVVNGVNYAASTTPTIKIGVCQNCGHDFRIFTAVDLIAERALMKKKLTSSIVWTCIFGGLAFILLIALIA